MINKPINPSVSLKDDWTRIGETTWGDVTRQFILLPEEKLKNDCLLFIDDPLTELRLLCPRSKIWPKSFDDNGGSVEKKTRNRRYSVQI